MRGVVCVCDMSDMRVWCVCVCIKCHLVLGSWLLSVGIQRNSQFLRNFLILQNEMTYNDYNCKMK